MIFCSCLFFSIQLHHQSEKLPHTVHPKCFCNTSQIMKKVFFDDIKFNYLIITNEKHNLKILKINENAVYQSQQEKLPCIYNDLRCKKILNFCLPFSSEIIKKGQQFCSGPLLKEAARSNIRKLPQNKFIKGSKYLINLSRSCLESPTYLTYQNQLDSSETRAHERYFLSSPVQWKCALYLLRGQHPPTLQQQSINQMTLKQMPSQVFYKQLVETIICYIFKKDPTTRQDKIQSPNRKDSDLILIHHAQSTLWRVIQSKINDKDPQQNQTDGKQTC